jgi:hypothetical protein
MKTNMSSADRGIRAILGVLLIVLGLTGVLAGTLAVVGYVLAAVFLLTAVVSFCPLYALLHISTSKA